MAKGLTYRDAVRLLGGDQGGLVTALDTVTTGLMLGGTVSVVPALLGWFDARAEFARLSRGVVGQARQRRAGSHRLGRTAQVEAAHTVLVIASFFEELAETPLPFSFASLAPTRDEQLRLAGGSAGESLAADLLATAVALPVPHRSHDEYLAELADFHRGLARAVTRFVSGLAAWDSLAQGQRDGFTEALDEIGPRAGQRYSDMLLDLVADFPEIAYWANLREHRSLRLSLQSLSDTLAEISSGDTPGEIRESFHRAYAAALDRAITESADIPEGMTVPTLAEAYVPPPFRVTGAPADSVASDEGVWAEVPVRDDLDDYLVGRLTSPGAIHAPMLVLGQPGAGKSVLTKVLPARLPAADFLPIRVVLREVDATKDLQGQIEDAVRLSTGDSRSWSEIAGAAQGALPVVLLDGFDELLQATGISQSNYLMDVHRFQEREREQGRAAAFVVTTRTSVADRARTPPGTVVLRLEPFDEGRTRRWVDVWNTANSWHFRSSGLRPLPAEAVLDYPDLAGQPLLLLLLALYDADGNALQHQSVPLGLGDLYERLLRAFARREARKHVSRLGSEETEAWIEAELRKLSIAAFAMFNRSSQWVTHADLEEDLQAILPPAPVASSFDAIAESALLVGRFFFVHRTQAQQRERTLHTYEFLHATFGEFLVARLTWELLREAGHRNPASSRHVGGVDDGGLYLFLSYSALAVRTPTVTFLEEMAAALDDEERKHLSVLLAGLYTAAPYEWRPDTASAQHSQSYRPARLPIPARIAVYTANLTLLAVVVTGGLAYSDLQTPRESPAANLWHNQATLWHSQLRAEEWNSLVDLIAVERCWSEPGNERDVRLALDFGRSEPAPPDPRWTFELPVDAPDDHGVTVSMSARLARRRANFQCCRNDDMCQHLSGAWVNSDVEIATRTFARVSAAQALQTVLLLPVTAMGAEERHSAYLECARIAASNLSSWPLPSRAGYGALLLAALSADALADAQTAAAVLGHGLWSSHAEALRCATAVLDRTRPGDPGFADLKLVIADLLRDTTPTDSDAATYAAALAYRFAGVTVDDSPQPAAWADHVRENAPVGDVLHLVADGREALARAVYDSEPLRLDLATVITTLESALSESPNPHAFLALTLLRAGEKEQRRTASALEAARQELADYADSLRSGRPRPRRSR